VTSTSSGRLFIEDVVSDRFDFQNPRARIWARQLNTENGSSTNVTNNGATLWILGMKTERGQTKLETLNGGFTELLGMHNYSTENPGTAPLFTVVDSSASFACVAESNFTGQPYTNIVSEARGATTTVLTTASLPGRTSANGTVMTLYTGFTGAPKRPLDLAATPAAGSVALAWNDQSWDETGFLIERSPDGSAWTTLITSASGATTFTDLTAAPGIAYQYRVRAKNAAGLSAPASAAATTFTAFQNWLVSFGFSIATNPLTDSDGDGLGVFLEYALSGTTSASDVHLLPVAQKSGSIFTLTWTRVRSELTYIAETSPDLSAGSWTTAGLTTTNDGPIFTATYTLASDARRFFRLRVTP